jgi:hypothetical protein
MITLMSISYQLFEKQISHDYYCQIVAHEVCDVSAKPIGSKKVENEVDGPCIGAPLLKLYHLFKMYLVACPYVAFKHYSILSHCNVVIFEPFSLEIHFFILSRCRTCDLSKSFPKI